MKNTNPTDETLLSVGTAIVNSVADEVKKTARAGTLGELLGRSGATGDEMKTGDNIADEVIIGMKEEFLKRGMGSVYLYSEEEGVYRLIDVGEEGIFMVIDPLDGSNNLRQGAPSPYVSVSVALGRLSDVAYPDTFDSLSVGVVRDIFNNRLYSGVRGQASSSYDLHDKVTTRLTTHDPDERRINIYTERDLEKSVLGIDLDKGKAEVSMHDRLEKLSPILDAKACQRRLGSSILDFCKVASGEYDAFITTGGRMRLHDIAAARLIVEGAGGTFEVNQPYEGNLLRAAFENPSRDEAAKLLKDTKYKAVASANPSIHDQVMEQIGNF